MTYCSKDASDTFIPKDVGFSICSLPIIPKPIVNIRRSKQVILIPPPIILVAWSPLPVWEPEMGQTLNTWLLTNSRSNLFPSTFLSHFQFQESPPCYSDTQTIYHVNIEAFSHELQLYNQLDSHLLSCRSPSPSVWKSGPVRFFDAPEP